MYVKRRWRVLLLIIVLAGLVGCTAVGAVEEDAHHEETLPELAPADLPQGTRLQVIVTTSIISDVVSNIGGDHIDMTTLMEAGQDPHSYEPTARNLSGLGEAHVIFVNGLGLEEGLLESIEAAAGDVPIVPVSAGIEPLPLGEHEDDRDDRDHAEGDPHVWLDPMNVMVWAENIAHMLGALDPANHEAYEANVEAYIDLLDELDIQIAQQVADIPTESRLLVTNHEALGYFAARYGFEIVGAVIAGGGTDADPSARDIAVLVEAIEQEDAPAIFIETTVSESLAEIVAEEVGREVAVLTLYTGSLGVPGSGAETYLCMMRTNTDTIVTGLTE